MTDSSIASGAPHSPDLSPGLAIDSMAQQSPIDYMGECILECGMVPHAEFAFASDGVAIVHTSVPSQPARPLKFLQCPTPIGTYSNPDQGVRQTLPQPSRGGPAVAEGTQPVGNAFYLCRHFLTNGDGLNNGIS
jgi:hypothetical protein